MPSCNLAVLVANSPVWLFSDPLATAPLVVLVVMRRPWRRVGWVFGRATSRTMGAG